MDRDVLKEKIKDADAVVAWARDRMDKEIIDLAPHLKGIANYGAGYDSVDVDYATQRGVHVTNTHQT